MHKKHCVGCGHKHAWKKKMPAGETKKKAGRAKTIWDGGCMVHCGCKKFTAV